MNDEEYKLHMTMWAAMKSPLIIGTDVTIMDAKTYSIYTNPAILAISQDPAGGAIIRKWRYYLSPTDSNGVGEIQMHSGSLDNGDYVVVLLNAATKEMQMNATAADIFLDEGGKKSAEAKSEWDVYDLWANRMPDETANMILNSNSTVGVANVTNYLYNATEMSYAEGIAKNVSVLMGKKVGTMGRMGTLSAKVPSHVSVPLIGRRFEMFADCEMPGCDGIQASTKGFAANSRD
jgi:alpha-galactosidase